ncbi:MAG: hypothetical protein FJY92_01110 [Candidatus Hydrogenedentes bacterium]|nr:hypothetical protein [Candidatus Hydrogenedentota bacterium]
MSAELDNAPPTAQPWWKSDYALIGCFAAFKVLLNGAFITRYGFQRDELYFIACGNHLSFGYVDHTPMVPWTARLTQTLFGESLFALRIPSLVAGALCVALVGLLVREMGGRRWAQAFACAAAIAAPAYLRAHSILHIPTFEMVYWTACFLILARIVNGGSEKLWLLFGAVAGLGLMNKPTVLFLGAGVAVALVLTPLRKHLLRPWVYAGGAIALLIFLPNLVWQYHHDFATYRFVKQLNANTMQRISFLDFMLGQVLYMGPLNALVWAPGLFYLLVSKHGAKYRALGIVCVTVFAIFVIAKAKVYYLAPAYPALFAGGAIAWSGLVQRRAWLERAAFALPAAGLIWLAPLGLPMLEIETAPRAIRALTGGVVDEHTAYEITGDWRDQHGWENTVAAVSKVYDSLSPGEKQGCIILTNNYGQAGAIDFFGRKHGLPNALCRFMTYYYWGPGDRAGDVAITVGLSRQHVAQYADVELAATVVNEHTVSYETNLAVLVCRKPSMPIQDAWKATERRGF